MVNVINETDATVDTYTLVLWPESQEYMEESWFRAEAYLCQALHDDQHHYDSAYFIPTYRLH